MTYMKGEGAFGRRLEGGNSNFAPFFKDFALRMFYISDANNECQKCQDLALVAHCAVRSSALAMVVKEKNCTELVIMDL